MDNLFLVSRASLCPCFSAAMEMHLPELDFQPPRSYTKDRHHYPHAPVWSGTQNWDRFLFLSPHFTGRHCHLNIIDRLSLWTYISCMNNVEVVLLNISLQVSWGSLQCILLIFNTCSNTLIFAIVYFQVLCEERGRSSKQFAKTWSKTSWPW